MGPVVLNSGVRCGTVWLARLYAWGALGLLSTAGLSGRAVAAANKQPTPEARLRFEALGIPLLSATFLGSGASMLTVNFVDDRHLLVTFGSRGLVPRTADDAEGDQDRIVIAELVELPTAKVLSRTQWHLHDHGRYLWPLGEGRFLLRIRQDLSTFAPLENLAPRDPWTRTSFAHRRGELQAIQVSADDKLLTVMTAPLHAPPKADPTQPQRTVSVTGSGEVADRTVGFIYIDFYRMVGKGGEGSPLELEHAGVVRSPEAIRLPIDGDGYLRSRGGPHSQWKVSFESYEGATRPLGPVGSSCPPVLNLTSRGQLLAFTCRGLNPDAITLQAYDFAGHELWEEPIGEVPVTPSFVYAPVAGRFAMSRLLPVASSPLPGGGDMPSMPAQELRVYQTQSGDLLLKVSVTPTFRTAENYDLAPDGMRVVVVHEGELDLYRLPELSKADREDLAEVEHMMPAAGGRGPINLHKLAEDDAQPAPLNNAEGTVAPAVAMPSTETKGSAQAAQPAAAGDSDAPRKPPTLLKPGEKAEYKDKGQPK